MDVVHAAGLLSALVATFSVAAIWAAFRDYMPGPPHAKAGTTSFIGMDPDGIWVGTAEAEGRGEVRRTSYASIGSVADTLNRVVIFNRSGAVLADVDAKS
jgi:hypothetical protein